MNMNMNMIDNNLAHLSSEFSDSAIKVSSDTHTDKGVNYAMVTLTHTGSNKRQHMGLALDFSTSMSQSTGLMTKKNAMVMAAETALKQMYGDNSVTVVAYGSHARVIIENALVSHPDTIPNIVLALEKQPYMGRTNPASALVLLKKCDQTMLLSDGHFNEGPTNHNALYGIVNHPILCGSVFPGTDMNEIADISEGTCFDINCDNFEHMQSLIASALSAPPIEASNVILNHNGTLETLPSIRNGCKTQYVIPIFNKDIEITYMDTNANTISITHKINVSGNRCEHIKHVLGLQKAAQLAHKAFETNSTELRRASTDLFKNMGVTINSYEDLRRESSSQKNQFSIEPDSLFCPETCRSSSQNVIGLIGTPIQIQIQTSPIKFK